MRPICKREGCDNDFDKKRDNHEFCQRTCYRKWYYDNIEGEEEETQPEYKCKHCGHVSKLDFDPVEEDSFIKFKNYECPDCGESVHK